ncbi:hotdog fold domain-containing protein [Thermodesulfobacteriota bacterium]
MMNQLLRLYQICEKFPFGKIIFSELICFKAPYFASIKPRFIQLRPGYCEVLLKKRRAVTNHLKSVHAIAMCNVSELTAGSMLEASIPKKLRWIPKGMTVSYLKMAKTDLKATCEISTDTLTTPHELPMTVHVTDTQGVEVFRAVINMYISKR